jgi:hypothetical protein
MSITWVCNPILKVKIIRNVLVKPLNLLDKSKIAADVNKTTQNKLRLGRSRDVLFASTNFLLLHLTPADNL